jgi:hypothetical protein
MPKTLTETERHNESKIASVLTEFAQMVRDCLERDPYFIARLELQVQSGTIRLAKIAAEKSHVFCTKSGESL